MSNIGKRIRMLSDSNFWESGQRFRVENEDEFYLYFDNADGKYCAIEKKLEGTDFAYMARSTDQEYYNQNRESVLEQKKNYRSDLKSLVVRRLGGRCSKCGYDKYAALDVKGGTPRGKMGYTAYFNTILRILEMVNETEYYLVCANCQRLNEDMQSVQSD